jgi:hypothetical protein
LTSLKTTIRIDPKLLRLEVLQHLLDSILDLLLAWNTRGVDIVDTRADVAGVGLIDKHLEELGVRFAVLDREDISIEGGNCVEEVLELRVAEVGVDLGRILDAGDGEAERLDGPVEVCFTLLAGTERKAFTEGWLINLDHIDTSGLKVDNLIAESESQLLGLDGLVDIVTREGPSETGDWTCQHALHWLLGDGNSVF